jgi:molybdopterin-guanine dinucleotide biosynthesis protein A
VSALSVVLLTGGKGTRMGGVSKAELTLNGYTFRNRILLALISVPQIIVVGPTFTAENPKISFTREQPIGGGPVAAISAAIPLVEHEFVGILSVDAPFAVSPLLEMYRVVEQDSIDEALVATDGKYESYLVSVFRRDALIRALTQLGKAENASMKSLLSHIEYGSVQFPRHQLIDVNTPEDLKRAEKESR